MPEPQIFLVYSPYLAKTCEGIMSKSDKEPIKGLNDEEIALLIDALTTLRAERGKVWNTACDIAQVANKRPPSLKKYGIDEITRLARRLGAKKTHWLD
jgi:hypothetical protein